MKYYAHSNGENIENWQLLKTHLENTADKMIEFSTGYCLPGVARKIGLLHDVGKYQQSFQNKLKGEKNSVEHSISGAKEWPFLASMFCIASHHTGLIDIGDESDLPTESTLYGRLKRKTEDYSQYKDEIKLEEIGEKELKELLQKMCDNEKEFAFWIRFMFSCLTDADFLDTEMFYNPIANRGVTIDFKQCLNKLNQFISNFIPDTKIKKARDNARQQVIDNYKEDAEIYFMNLPTGSGKTITSMNFALKRAIYKHKKRIIYVIPYTSIIEQNAKVFKNIFGEFSLLEHHCNFTYKNEESESLSIIEKIKKSSENWDSSIIITTNVRFFESIYSNKSRDLRKLHNIANSIIIFDEVHSLPTDFFKPCLDAISILTNKYNCEAVFMSATMPDFNVWLEKFGCKNTKTFDLISDKSLYKLFQTSRIINLGEIYFDDLVSKINYDEKTLIVVNKKKTAKDIYDKLTCKKFHLSTYMTHYDREIMIKSIKKAINEKEGFCLVSTSLIEAGVDLDFDIAYREIMGLDNLLQTAGRCNREGKKQNAITYSFELHEDEYKIKSNEIREKQYFTKEIFEQFDNVQKLEAITKYFDRLYDYAKDNMMQMDFDRFTTSRGFKFKEYAEKFKIIDDNSVSVIILNNNYNFICNLIKKAEFEPKKALKELQKYSVSLKNYEYDILYKQGVLQVKNNITYLANEKYYDEKTGIKFDEDFIYIV